MAPSRTPLQELQTQSPCRKMEDAFVKIRGLADLSALDLAEKQDNDFLMDKAAHVTLAALDINIQDLIAKQQETVKERRRAMTVANEKISLAKQQQLFFRDLCSNATAELDTVQQHLVNAMEMIKLKTNDGKTVLATSEIATESDFRRIKEESSRNQQNLKKLQSLYNVLEKQLESSKRMERERAIEAEIATSALEASQWKIDNLEKSQQQQAEMIENNKNAIRYLHDELAAKEAQLKECNAQLEQVEYLSAALGEAQKQISTFGENRQDAKDTLSEMISMVATADRQSEQLKKHERELLEQIGSFKAERQVMQQKIEELEAIRSTIISRDVMHAAVQTEEEVPTAAAAAAAEQNETEEEVILREMSETTSAGVMEAFDAVEREWNEKKCAPVAMLKRLHAFMLTSDMRDHIQLVESAINGGAQLEDISILRDCFEIQEMSSAETLSSQLSSCRRQNAALIFQMDMLKRELEECKHKLKQK